MDVYEAAGRNDRDTQQWFKMWNAYYNVSTGFDIVHLSNHDALAGSTLDESKPVSFSLLFQNFLSSDLEISS